jgi:hypothetical protein
MAKTTSKTPVKTEKKKAAPKKAVPSSDQIVKVCEMSLGTLATLDIEHSLQSEINWCLGSFQNDGNPIGLFQMAERSLAIFKAEQAKKTKGITAKLVGDIEKALKSR